LAIKCPKCNSDNTDTALYCSKCATWLTQVSEPGVSVTRALETSTDELTCGTTFDGRYEIIKEPSGSGRGAIRPLM
jgi:hypothetical protein